MCHFSNNAARCTGRRRARSRRAPGPRRSQCAQRRARRGTRRRLPGPETAVLGHKRPTCPHKSAVERSLCAGKRTRVFAAQRAVDVAEHGVLVHCPAPEPLCWGSRRPARPYKSPIEKQFARGTRRARKRPGRARTEARARWSPPVHAHVADPDQAGRAHDLGFGRSAVSEKSLGESGMEWISGGATPGGSLERFRPSAGRSKAH